MNSSWVTNCDMLADAGIINFDAAAYITGTKPRYVGSPNVPVYDLPPLNYSQPPQDEFKQTTPSAKDDNIVKNPLWKKVLFSILAAGGLIWGFKKISNFPGMCKNLGTKIADFFKNIFKK